MLYLLKKNDICCDSGFQIRLSCLDKTRFKSIRDEKIHDIKHSFASHPILT